MAVKSDATDFTGLFDGRPKSEHYEIPKADAELVAQLKEWVKRCEDNRHEDEQQWRLNHSFLQGDQVLGRHKLTGDIVRLSVQDSKRLKVKNNVLKPVARSLVGKLSAMIPTFSVNPATSNFEERQAAIAADVVLQLVREGQDLDQKYDEANNYLPAFGNAFLHLTWNSSAGKEIAFCEACNYFTYDVELTGADCPTCTMQKQAEQALQQNETAQAQAEEMTIIMSQLPPGQDFAPEELAGDAQDLQIPVKQLGPLPPEQPVPQLLSGCEGDINVDVLSPFDVFVSPGVSKIKKATRWGVRELLEVSQATREYPDFAPYITAEPANDAFKIKSAFTTGYHGNSSTIGLDDHVFRWTFYEAPTAAYPKGRLIVVINEMVVLEMDNPYYDLGRPNLYHFGFDLNVGSLYYDAPLTNAWERQRELNIIETQGREAIDSSLRRKMLVPQGAGITIDSLTTDTQDVISFNPAGGTPIELRGVEVPQAFWTRKQDLNIDIRTQMCVTDPDMGLIGNDPNGRAMAILSAEADKQIGPTLKRNNAEYRDMHFGILRLYQQYAHEDRQSSEVGDQGCAIEYFRLLKLLKPGFRVILDEEDGMSRNPAVRFQQALSLMQATSGQYFIDKMTGQFDKKAFGKMARLRVLDQGADREATEQAAASKLPILLEKGEFQWKPRLFDVPMIWADTLEDWLRGPGRSAPIELSVQVEQIWMFYKQWAVTGQPPLDAMGAGGPPSQANQQTKPGQEMSAPGGTPANQMASGGAKPISTQARQQISQADAAGEQAARVEAKHEN